MTDERQFFEQLLMRVGARPCNNPAKGSSGRRIRDAGLAPENVEAQSLIRRLAPLYPAPPEMKPQEWNDRWAEALGMPPDAALLSQEEERVVIGMMREQAPWEAPIDLERLRQGDFPKVVFSGRWNEAFSAVCDSHWIRSEFSPVRLPGNRTQPRRSGKGVAE